MSHISLNITQTTSPKSKLPINQNLFKTQMTPLRLRLETVSKLLLPCLNWIAKVCKYLSSAKGHRISSAPYSSDFEPTYHRKPKLPKIGSFAPLFFFRLKNRVQVGVEGKLKRRTEGLITSPHYISSPRPFLRAPPLLESSLRTSAPFAHPCSIICPDTSPLSPAPPHSLFPSPSLAGEGGNPREETGR